MGCNKYSITSTCSGSNYATCTFYQEELPEWSEYFGQEDCTTTAQTTTEIYKELTEIKESLNNEDLKGSCIPYPNSNPTQKEVNKAVQEKLCEMALQMEAMGTPESGLLCTDLDYGNLLDTYDCETKPGTWCEFAQFILDALKNIENE